MLPEVCNRCQMKSPESDLLKEVASTADRSLSNIVRQAMYSNQSPVREKSQKFAQERMEQVQQELAEYRKELSRLEEELSYQAMESLLQGKKEQKVAQEILDNAERKALEEKIRALAGKSQEVTEEDIMQTIQELEKNGYIEIQKGMVKITSKGARRLADNVLERLLRRLSSRDLGAHSLEETGFGAEFSYYSRPYEAGDDYSRVDIEGTAINALERRGSLDLEPEDFDVFEETHQSRLCVGLLIDESGSMRSNHKLGGAIEASLALAELVRREPKDKIRSFIFSEFVKEIPSWNIVNDMMSGGCTDIKGALRAFRKAVREEKGDKQAYLVTDTEPNTEDGKYVGFERAMAGVLEEALRYKQENITLNIIMLDEAQPLRQLASVLARQNLGRVFFTSPMKLGAVVVEDYLRTKKGKK